MNNPYQTLPLFSFGSLMDLELLVLVSGQSIWSLALQPAVLPGFAQREVLGDNFPVLVPDTSAQTRGNVISGLTPIGMQRILFFEGEEYALSPIAVELTNGVSEQCVYFKDTAVYQVMSSQWDFEHWVAQHKPGFLQRTQHYMSYFGKLSAAEADKHW